MTSKQVTKLQTLRVEADMHGDDVTVALVDAALGGDATAAAKLGIARKAAQAAEAASNRKGRRTSAWAAAPAADAHPWAFDEI